LTGHNRIYGRGHLELATHNFLVKESATPRIRDLIFIIRLLLILLSRMPGFFQLTITPATGSLYTKVECCMVIVISPVSWFRPQQIRT
jgi:hypothetical protein